eukprot:TRINITY_DN11371_c0_g1_i2.p1 TRINITY_DN11371_c0_g1~~TRINITY_DN11371_c0_g1_i2.p1  ORF type:complete len:229 (+),score=64.66 TRINITY_DN11371_c0_g1_i2:236-922(+)
MRCARRCRQLRAAGGAAAEELHGALAAELASEPPVEHAQPPGWELRCPPGAAVAVLTRTTPPRAPGLCGEVATVSVNLCCPEEPPQPLRGDAGTAERLFAAVSLRPFPAAGAPAPAPPGLWCAVWVDAETGVYSVDCAVPLPPGAPGEGGECDALPSAEREWGYAGPARGGDAAQAAQFLADRLADRGMGRGFWQQVLRTAEAAERAQYRWWLSAVGDVVRPAADSAV